MNASDIPKVKSFLFEKVSEEQEGTEGYWVYKTALSAMTAVQRKIESEENEKRIRNMLSGKANQ